MATAKRVLLFPAALVVWLTWFLLQLLFAMDAFLILVMGFVGLLLAVRIVLPDLVFSQSIRAYSAVTYSL